MKDVMKMSDGRLGRLVRGRNGVKAELADAELNRRYPAPDGCISLSEALAHIARDDTDESLAQIASRAKWGLLRQSALAEIERRKVGTPDDGQQHD